VSAQSAPECAYIPTMAVERNLMPGRAVVIAVFAALIAYPSTASAHGPIAPVASSYLAKVRSAPDGLEATAVDGDQRMWLRVKRAETVVVLDYLGAPYLHFSRSGVSVNRHSELYYLNHSPAEVPPSGITRLTPPEWHALSAARDYVWHDGRLHALASVAISSSTSFVGNWRIPLTVDGRPGAIRGGLWHASDPSIVWFWPIIVLLACVLAAVRLRRPTLDRQLARALGVAAVVSLALGGAGQELYGRPTVGAPQLAIVAVLGVVAVWGVVGALRASYFALLAIAFGALWIGSLLVPTLLHGFVLAALPAFLTRVAAVLCLASSLALILLVFGLALGEDHRRSPPNDDVAVTKSVA
jgi:hypothetical protein